jgi:sec-independent protein translocase protein TatA
MLLFGRGKISEMMGDVAKGIKAFKKGMSDDETAPTSTTSTTTVVPPASEPIRNLEHQATAGTPTAATTERKVS